MFKILDLKLWFSVAKQLDISVDAGCTRTFQLDAEFLSTRLQLNDEH